MLNLFKKRENRLYLYLSVRKINIKTQGGNEWVKYIRVGLGL